METKELFGVEYRSDMTDLEHSTFEIFNTKDEALDFANTLSDKEKIELFSQNFNLDYVWEEDGKLQYDDCSELFEGERKTILVFDFVVYEDYLYFENIISNLFYEENFEELKLITGIEANSQLDFERKLEQLKNSIN